MPVTERAPLKRASFTDNEKAFKDKQFSNVKCQQKLDSYRGQLYFLGAKKKDMSVIFLRKNLS